MDDKARNAVGLTAGPRGNWDMMGKSGETVLILDKDDGARRNARNFLESWAIWVISAGDTEKGLELLAQEKPDLVILDLDSDPAGDEDALAAIKRLSPETPVIVVSNRDRLPDAMDALRRGALDYLAKPFLSMDILLHSVLKGLEYKKLQEQNREYQEHLERMVDKRTRDLERANLRMEEMNQSLRDLVQSVEKLSACQETEELADELLTAFVDKIKAAGGVVYLLEEKGIRLAACDGPCGFPGFIPAARVEEAGVADWMQRGRPEKINLAPLGVTGPEGCGTALGVPLMDARKDPVGLVCVFSSKPDGSFSKPDREIGTVLASYGGKALRALAASEAQKESAHKYRLLAENLKDVVLAVSPGGKVLYCSPAIQEFGGYDASQWINGNFLDCFFDSREADEAREFIQRIKARREADSMQFLFKARDAEPFPVGLSAKPVVRDGRVVSIHCVMRDITSRVKAEKELMHARAKLATAIDKSPVGFIMVEAEGMAVELVNEAAEKILNVEAGSLTGRPIRELFSMRRSFREDGSVLEPEQDSLLEAITGGKAHSNQKLRMLLPGDEERWVLRNTVPIFNDQGEVIAGICAFLDITEARKMENKIIQTEKLASLGLLVSAISHEISNPIHYISCNMPILKNYLDTIVPLADEAAAARRDQDYLGMPYQEFRQDLFTLHKNIAHGASRIQTIVADLREFSHMENVRSEEWIDLEAELQKVVAICQKQIRQRVKTFEMKIDPGMPMVYSNAKAIEQVVVNLLINASHASDKEDSLISLRVRVDHNGTQRLVIEVEDNGKGLDEKLLPKIFDPFFTTKPPQEGTGLGLYVSKNLIEGLGGWFEIESRLGEGALFRVVLPLESSSLNIPN